MRLGAAELFGLIKRVSKSFSVSFFLLPIIHGETFFFVFCYQDNIHLLYQRAVAYLNVDSPIRGTDM